MKPKIEIYTTGYSQKSRTSYGAVMSAVAPDGRIMASEPSGMLGEFTKNQADIISITMALRCVLPQYRDCEIILHGPPGYGGQVVEVGETGEYKSHPKSNVELVQEARDTIKLFPNLKVVRTHNYERPFKRCMEVAKQAWTSK